MATVRHAFDSAKDDPVDTSVVGASKWDADHEVEGVFTVANVMDATYGAVGDGVADDSAAIQAAVSDLPAAGGTLLLPGVHNCETGVTDDGKSVRFLGLGKGSGLVGTGISILTLTAFGSGNEGGGSTVESMQIKDPVGDADTIGIDISNGSTGVNHWALRDLFITGTGLLGKGVRTVFGLEGVMDNLTVEGWDDGVYLNTAGGSSQSNANCLVGCKLRANNTGLKVPAAGTYGLSLNGCTIEGNQLAGIDYAGKGPLVVQGTHFEQIVSGKPGITLAAGWLISIGNGYYQVSANKDIVVSAGAGFHTSIGDLLNQGITHNGSGGFAVRDPLTTPAVAGTGPITLQSYASISQLQPLGNNALVLNDWAYLTSNKQIRMASLGVISAVGVIFDVNATGDTNLYRAAANVLKTDDALTVVGVVTLGAGVVLTGISSAHLRVDGLIQSHNASAVALAFSAYVGAEATSRWTVDQSGLHAWGNGTAAVDTNLYRSAADSLKTDDTFTALVFAALGLTGATAASRYAGATASGAPTTGTFAVGDWIIARDGHILVCTTAGTPGTWTDVGGTGSHPDLAAHDTLGLATQTELDNHTADTSTAHAAASVDAVATGGGGTETVKAVGVTGSTETIALALSDGNVQTFTVNADCTFTMPSSLGAGAKSFTAILTDSGGPRAITFTGVKWSGGANPTVMSGASAVDIFTFLTIDGGTTWYGFIGGQAMAV